jgi:DNA-binding PadR family transcriptional regulator
MILQAIGAGHIYGYTVMEVTGLPSGTVYPAMRRLERDQLIRSQWECQSVADAALRPPRKCYKLTRPGEMTLETSRKRYPLLAKLVPTEEVHRA